MNREACATGGVADGSPDLLVAPWRKGGLPWRPGAPGGEVPHGHPALRVQRKRGFGGGHGAALKR